MKLKPTLFILACLTFIQIKASHAQSALKAHEHGSGVVVIALENERSGILTLDVPGEAIIGFEHRAQTSEDQSSQKQALAKLKAATPLEFSPAMGCNFKNEKIEIEAKEIVEKTGNSKSHSTTKSHSAHSDIQAAFQMNCEKSILGSHSHLLLFKDFKNLKKLKVQIITSQGQSEKIVQNEKDAIDF